MRGWWRRWRGVGRARLVRLGGVGVVGRLGGVGVVGRLGEAVDRADGGGAPRFMAAGGRWDYAIGHRRRQRGCQCGRRGSEGCWPGQTGSRAAVVGYTEMEEQEKRQRGSEEGRGAKRGGVAVEPGSECWMPAGESEVLSMRGRGYGLQAAAGWWSGWLRAVCTEQGPSVAHHRREAE